MNVLCFACTNSSPGCSCKRSLICYLIAQTFSFVCMQSRCRASVHAQMRTSVQTCRGTQKAMQRSRHSILKHAGRPALPPVALETHTVAGSKWCQGPDPQRLSPFEGTLLLACLYDTCGAVVKSRFACKVPAKRIKCHSLNQIQVRRPNSKSHLASSETTLP